MMAFILWLSAALLFLAIRVYPIWPQRFQGCDAYFILLCAETLRWQRRLPIVLPPLYLLERREQWYPPGFLLLCALLPQHLLQRYYWLLNHLVDLLNISIVFVFAVEAGQAWLGVVAIVAYALFPGLVLEYASLTTRPLGVVLLSGFLLAAYFGMQSWPAAGLALLCGVALLYSHKLTTQQLWFTLPFVAAATADWRWLVWLPVLYLAAFIVWPRGFVRILDAHRVIVVFWSRYWRLLGAHAVRQSPVYGDGHTRTDVYRNGGWRAAIGFAKDTAHQNYLIMPVLALAWPNGFDEPFERFLLGWILSAYVAGVLTHFIPTLRGIGLGRQYVKFGILPTLLYLAVHAQAASPLVPALLAVALVLLLRQYALIAANSRSQQSSQSGQVSEPLMRLLAKLRDEPEARVMCLPVHLCDLVSYVARVPTYWGTHGDTFDERLATFFPVLQHPLETYVKDGMLTHLLLDRSYVKPEELGLRPAALAGEEGDFLLFHVAMMADASGDYAGHEARSADGVRVSAAAVR